MGGGGQDHGTWIGFSQGKHQTGFPACTGQSNAFAWRKYKCPQEVQTGLSFPELLPNFGLGQQGFQHTAPNRQ